MKRLSKIILTCLILVGTSTAVIGAPGTDPEVREGIHKYKAKDYVGCIQDMQEVVDNDVSNAVAYYYLGMSFMQVGMNDKAIESFKSVVDINTVPRLSSYAIQATNCMNNNLDRCEYKNLSASQIDELIKDPSGFLTKLSQEPGADLVKAEQIEIDETDIDKLIQGKYPSGIHPDASKVLQETRLIQEQERVNIELNQKMKNNKSDASSTQSAKLAYDMPPDSPTDKQIADAVKTLSNAGYTFNAPNNNINPAAYQMPDYMPEMAMMFGNSDSNRSRGNDMMMMLPYLMNQKNPDGSQTKVNPEVLKSMMMNQMMYDFDFGFDNDKNK